MLKCVIYDMDDLMVNSYPLHEEVDKLLVKGFGHEFDEIPQDIRSVLLVVELSIFLKQL